MFGINLHSVSFTYARQRLTQVLTQKLSSVIAPVQHTVTRRLTFAVPPAVMSSANSLLLSSNTLPLSDGNSRDRWRQALNLLLSITQVAAATLLLSSDVEKKVFRNGANREPLIVPADYTFAIWGVIFVTSIAYGVFQALPQQHTNDLLRRIGFLTAIAFGCNTLWSVAARVEPLWSTVVLFFGALGALIYALYTSSHHWRRLTLAEQLLVVTPISVYAAWCTIGTVANLSTSLFAVGYTDPFFREQTWAAIIIVVAGAISSFVTTVTGGNIPYALGIIWGLIGIVVATLTERPNRVVAITAGAMAGVVSLVLWRARRNPTSDA